MTDKRQKFLEIFLKSLGVKTIHWTDRNESSVFGTAIYDLTGLNERQDFVWHMNENKMPADKVLNLLTYLTDNKLLDIDKIKVSVTDIEIPNCDQEEKEKLFDELFRVKVNMIDNGQETDYYYIHD